MDRAENSLILSRYEQLFLSKSIYRDLQQKKNQSRSTRQHHYLHYTSCYKMSFLSLVTWNRFTKQYTKHTHPWRQPTFQSVRRAGQETFKSTQTFALLCNLSYRDFIIASRLFPKLPTLSQNHSASLLPCLQYFQIFFLPRGHFEMCMSWSRS